ncbi:MAG: response regulator transcription factor [Velocimicrobium sp.]
MKKILLIEDDKPLSNGICLAIKTNVISVIQCFDLHTAKEQYRKMHFDLLILDINLPDGNGLDFLKELKQTPSTPVILLTANDMEIDIVSGLELGADDYITKPFSLAVLRARINTQLRKLTTISSSKRIIDDYIFDFDHMEYSKSGIFIELSKTEQKLLRCLVENSGIILSRETLIDRIWTNDAEYVDENALSVTIKRLRNKLKENPSKPQYIKTVHGIGYTWAVNH